VSSIELGAHMQVEAEIRQAVYNGNVDRITQIFNRVGPDEARRLADLTDSNDDPMVHVAIKKRRIDVFDVLSGAGADLKARDGPNGPNEALHIAAMYGNIAVSKRIIKKIKPMKNALGSWPSQLAAKYHHEELAHMLELAEADELISAVREGDAIKLNKIITDLGPEEARRQVNLKDEKGAPILHIPARKNTFPVYEALVAAGADKKATDRDANEAMHVAALSGSMNFAKKLIESGIKPKPNSRNAWPSQLATAANYLELAHMLQMHEQVAGHASIVFLRRDETHQAIRQRYSDMGGFVYRKQKV
jgi:ankyrin repeat protein